MGYSVLIKFYNNKAEFKSALAVTALGDLVSPSDIYNSSFFIIPLYFVEIPALIFSTFYSDVMLL
jgi:hypothetical protein